MNDAEKIARAALVISQSAAAVIEAFGMAAENLRRDQNGMTPAYGTSAFVGLIEQYGLGWNTVIGRLRGEP